MKRNIIILIVFVLAMSLVSVDSFADGKKAYYELTITNLTRGQTFTPILVASHKNGVKLFTPGSPASEELAMLAEGGDTDPLAGALLKDPRVGDVASSGGLLGPGKTVTVNVSAARRLNYVSLAAMLIPTNDAFIALNGVRAPRGRNMLMYQSPAFDAGSEVNDELCDNIPGPFGCDGTGEGYNPDDGETYVHIHAGIHGIADLDEAEYDWRNPVARVVIKRVIMRDEDDDD